MRRTRSLVLAVTAASSVAIGACGPAIENTGTDAGLVAPIDAGDADAGATGTPDAGAPDGGPPACPADMTCVTTFPFGDDRDTAASSRDTLDAYSCKPSADESGPEIVYRVTLPTAGFLSAAVTQTPGVDVDVHILSRLDGAACLARGDFDAGADVGPGEVFVVIDTYVASGVAAAGAFHVDLGFTVPSHGACDMASGSMPRVGDGGNTLQMPATGDVVVEAHLVTQEEPPPYPSTPTEKLKAHYALSQARTGLVMHRVEDWAPLEGGSFYGAGIGSPESFPVLDEGWYVNMYWTSAARPARGTRMILRVPGTNRAVVVAAGYETGPGNLARIGGAPEEVHFYLGRSATPWTLGIATDATLPLGPRRCE